MNALTQKVNGGKTEQPNSKKFPIHKEQKKDWKTMRIDGFLSFRVRQRNYYVFILRSDWRH